MRKMFQLGGPLGLCFNQERIDLSFLKDEPLGAILPDGLLYKLIGMEIIFYKPDFSDIADSSAHRATHVKLNFKNENDDKTEFEIQGPYFWRFLESVPEPFSTNPLETEDESYINGSLRAVMNLARYLYQGCFVDTTIENACPPPISCYLNFEDLNVTVKEALVLPDNESKIVSGEINQKISGLDLSLFADKFVDDMLQKGYLIHGFKKTDGGIRPDFTPASWDNSKHKVIRDYLSELSSYSIGNCPAYTLWSEYLKYKLKVWAEQLFNQTFSLNNLQDRDDLPVAKRIVESGDNLFEIQGSNESVDLMMNRVLVELSKFLESKNNKSLN
ncbi:hypothetical protein L1267_11175 [Pseudoalteromonas sp. OFAV1]|jgi:hypothetical protein|uniref:hypothetical protein n=1 Tax=Pseudoalteromonas sp. OFAV1 TaxID=2908892 RepID=UPI001F1BC91A|nr:hypothetical protein [Pseudoalteromonas sp. OFAV1]MCF2900966.1 hypothetical protein [Pseudoalteromonas sp. OFAV1]